MEAITSLNTKISVTDKELFVKTTEALGLTPSGAIKIFVRMFNQCGGFPFEVRTVPLVNYNNPNILKPEIRNENVVLPASWREDDDYDHDDAKKQHLSLIRSGAFHLPLTINQMFSSSAPSSSAA